MIEKKAINKNHSPILTFPQQEQDINKTVIVFMDLQNEYLSSGRAYALNELKDCLTNCKAILDMARSLGITIAHFRTIIDGAFFNKNTDFSKWIDEFSPRPHEMIFEKIQPSIFSNNAFTKIIENISNPSVILVGLSGERSCLSTAIEGRHRNWDITYVADASASSALGENTEKESHKFIIELIRLYSNIIDTEKCMSKMSEANQVRW